MKYIICEERDNGNYFTEEYDNKEEAVKEAQNVVINQYKIKKLSFPIDGIYNYNVQRWTSTDGGKTFAYCGFGKYCRTEAEAQAYKKEREKL